MAGVPQEFTRLLPRVAAEATGEPVYWLFVYDPLEDRVHLENNEGRHRADHVTHGDLADRFPHPARIHGYAYRIQGGYRVTDWEHKALTDPHILDLVRSALRREAVENKPHMASVTQIRALHS